MEAISSISSEPDGATAEQRIDFLKEVVRFTESNIRDYDTKAEIALAAFVLFAHPLVVMADSACSKAGSRGMLMVIVPCCIVTITAYLWVLWPVAGALGKLTEGVQNIFFIHDPSRITNIAYAERLKKLSLEPELASEALKLAHIRRVKARRFKSALIVTLLSYLIMAMAFVVVTRCS